MTLEYCPCDLCGTREYKSNMVEMLPGFNVDGVKLICDRCASIVNEYASQVHAFADKVGKRMQAKMQKHLDNVNKERRASQHYWFFQSLKGLFKNMMLRRGFTITRPQTPAK